MAAPSISAWRNSPLLQHVDKVIADNRRFWQSNRPQEMADEMQLAGKKAAKQSRGWMMSAALAVATYFIGRTLMNYLLPKPEAEPYFEVPEKTPFSLAGKLATIGGLTAGFKWLGKKAK